MISTDGQPRYYPIGLRRTNETGVVRITADSQGIRLGPPGKAGPLDFDSPDGSVGRNTLPRGFAIDALNRCYFVERSAGAIWFFDPEGPRSGCHPFVRLLQFPAPSSENQWKLWSLAATTESLYLIRPDEPGVISVGVGYWAIEEIYCFGKHEWARDIATYGNRVFVLTDNKVYSRKPLDPWSVLAELPTDHAQRYIRLLVSRDGEVYVQRESGDMIRALDPNSGLSIDRTLFPVPRVVTHSTAQREQNFQYLISESLASPVERCCQTPVELPDLPPELATPEVNREMLEGDDLSRGFLIREDGLRIRKETFRPATQRVFFTGNELMDREDVPTSEKGSVWHSLAVDSRRYRCRWDRVELGVRIPPGCRVTVSTLTLDDDPLPHEEFTNRISGLPDKVLAAPDSNWSQGASFEATSQRSDDVKWLRLDFLVRSQPGRYLFLRINLFGDGFSTPVARNLFACGPRRSHADFLPSVLREDDASRDFLERFVSVFQTEWDDLEKSVDEMDRLFNPVTIREPQIDQFAKWFGISLPAGWDNRKYRQLLKFVPELLMAPGDERTGKIGGTRRGTVVHLRKAARTILAGLTGLTECQMRGFPWIIEGFRERNQLRLATLEQDRLAPPTGASLWGPDSVGRLQLGDNSVLGERKLLPTNREELDLYRTHAHRIRVVVPACWVRNQEDLCALEEMIDAEKPAHIVSSITLVRPQFRIGLQSTVGIDTILGDWPRPVLAADPAIPNAFGLGQGLLLPDAPDQRPPPVVVGSVIGERMN